MAVAKTAPSHSDAGAAYAQEPTRRPANGRVRVSRGFGLRSCVAGLGICLATAAAAASAPVNDVSSLCVRDGATIEVETAESGAKKRICVFANGTRIGEQAYVRNKRRSLK